MQHSTINRRRFLGASAASAAALSLADAVAKDETTKRPNILFIMTDQQRADLMGCEGDQWVKTPGLDRLAASGVRFERAYATNPVCVPSRFSLQTGRMPSAVGMGGNEGAPVPAAMGEQCLGALLRRAGYETVYGGKVHVPQTLHEAMFDGGYRMLTEDRRQTLADACCAYLRESHEKPFFLTVSLINPHDICYMPLNDNLAEQGKPPIDNEDSKVCEGVLDQARATGDLAAFAREHCPPLPENFAIPKGEPEAVNTHFIEGERWGGLRYRKHCRENWTDEDWRLYRWCYRRLMEMADQKIAQILEALEASGLAEDTLVVYTSDHGDMDAAHRLEHKSLLYEEATRVPLIMSWKDVLPAGRVDDMHFVSNGLDLLPTLCDYAGGSTPPDLPGRSLRSLAEGHAPDDWPDHVVVECSNGRMLRTDRFKYVVYEDGANRETLVNLEDDPGEMMNLADAPEMGEALNLHREMLATWVNQHGDSIAQRYIIEPSKGWSNRVPSRT
jgi:arylsulfatase A-like enzyme